MRVALALPPFVFSMLLTLAGFGLLFLLAVAALSRRKKSARVERPLVGRVASVERALNPEGFVMVGGELWPARARGGVSVGRGRWNVRVVGSHGYLLEVEIITSSDPARTQDG